MTYKKTFKSVVKHWLYVESIDQSKIPSRIDTTGYNQFYVVRNTDSEGVPFMYLGKGHSDSPFQIVVWYYNTGSMWASFGVTINGAVNGAIKDGWLYA